MPKKKVEYKTRLNWLQILMELASTAILIGIFVYVIIHFSSLPDSIPKSYDMLGEIKTWGKRGGIWFMPVFCLVAYILLTIMLARPKIIRLPKAVCNEHQIYMQNLMVYLLCLVKLETFSLVVYTLYHVVALSPVDPYVTFLFQMTLFGTMVVGVYRIFKIPSRFRGYYR